MAVCIVNPNEIGMGTFHFVSTCSQFKQYYSIHLTCYNCMYNINFMFKKWSTERIVTEHVNAVGCNICRPLL